MPVAQRGKEPTWQAPASRQPPKCHDKPSPTPSLASKILSPLVRHRAPRRRVPPPGNGKRHAGGSFPQQAANPPPTPMKKISTSEKGGEKTNPAVKLSTAEFSEGGVTLDELGARGVCSVAPIPARQRQISSTAAPALTPLACRVPRSAMGPGHTTAIDAPFMTRAMGHRGCCLPWGSRQPAGRPIGPTGGVHLGLAVA